MTRRVVDGRNPASPINGTGFLPSAFQHISPPEAKEPDPEPEALEELAAKASHRGMRTMYKGFPLRSKLEARWCVFFDSLGISWDYELEAFEGDFGKSKGYCPDFYLSTYKLWVEVKPKFPSEEERSKCQAIADFTGQEVLLIWGYPGPFTERADRGILSFHKGREMSATTIFGYCAGCRSLTFYPKDKIHPCVVSAENLALAIQDSGHLPSVLNGIISGAEEVQKYILEYRSKIGWYLDPCVQSILTATEKARVFRDFFWEPATAK